MVNLVLRFLLAALFWPGLAGGALLGWLYLWVTRKIVARLQGRQGPPFYQPFFDFIKLTGKTTVIPGGANPGLFFVLPLLALLSVIAGLALLPAPLAPFPGFNGDLILLLYLLEMPALVDILAGYVTRSPYAQVGASREAVMMLGYNLPFLTALIALALQSGSTNLHVIVAHPLGPVQILAALALLMAMPARMKTTPFSIPNAETEIVAGPHIEYNARPLAVFELSHGLELAALAGLFAAILVGPVANPILGLLLYLLVSLAVIGFTAVLAAATARLKVQHAMRFYFRWGALAAVLALAVAALIKP